jgi:undecaprenyl-diphosphatase
VDHRLFHTVNDLSGGSFSDGLFKLIANDLPVVLMAAVALIFLVPWRRRGDERRRGAVLATASAALGLLLAQPIAHLVDRPRPFMAGHAHLLIARSHDPSFPSDHATGAFALAFGVWLYDRTLGGVLLVLAALLSFARVYVGTHYPGDVIAGAVLGAGVAGALYLLPPTRALVETVAARAARLSGPVIRKVFPA